MLKRAHHQYHQQEPKRHLMTQLGSEDTHLDPASLTVQDHQWIIQIQILMKRPLLIKTNLWNHQVGNHDLLKH